MSKSSVTLAVSPEQITERILEYLWNFPKFCLDCLWIQPKEGGELIPFRLNRNQLVLWERIKSKLERGEPIRLIILKARQIGMSTFCMALMYWFISLRENRNAIVAAYNDPAALNLFEKAQLFYKYSPSWVRPMTRIFNRERILFAHPKPEIKEGLNSQILTESSDNVRMGRSWALHFFLGSECPMWNNPGKIVTAVQNAMPKKTPGTFLLYEGTSEGMNYYYKMWQEADERGLERVFISWVAMDQYRHDLTPKQVDFIYEDLYDFDHDIFGNETTEISFIQEQLKEWYPEEATSTKWMRNEVACRLSWRRDCIVQDCDKDLNEFKKEYPTYADQAWVSGGKSIFPTVQLAAQRRAFNAAVAEEGITPVRFRWNDAASTWVQSTRGHLVLFEPLRAGETYVLGSDVALGLDNGDFSTAVLLRLPDCIVSGVFEDRLPPTLFARILADLGRRAGDALLGVEANEEGGYTVNRELVEVIHYPRIYRRETFDTIGGKRQKKAGWKSTGASKEIAINGLREAILYDELIINDDRLFEQLLAYQEIEIGTSGRVVRKCPAPLHDDLADACMIAYQMARQVSKQISHKSAVAPAGSLAAIEEQLRKMEREKEEIMGLG